MWCKRIFSSLYDLTSDDSLFSVIFNIDQPLFKNIKSLVLISLCGISLLIFSYQCRFCFWIICLVYLRGDKILTTYVAIFASLELDTGYSFIRWDTIAFVALCLFWSQAIVLSRSRPLFIQIVWWWLIFVCMYKMTTVNYTCITVAGSLFLCTWLKCMRTNVPETWRKRKWCIFFL
jgi:hypothetical protein